jgi:hypothetical protein
LLPVTGSFIDFFLPIASEVLFKGIAQFSAPIVKSIQLAQEESEHGRLGDKLQSFDQLTIVV